jgi:hypothetical protein
MNQNIYNICTLNQNSNCNECKIKGRLDCKLDKNHQKTSMKTIFSFIIIALLGLISTGFITNIWWLLVLYFVFIVLFFFLVETRVTCSHCPYYAENKKLLNCTGNNFFPKIWKFNPKPINKTEKIISIFGFVFIGFFPILCQLFNIWYIFSTYPNFNKFFVIIPIILLFVTVLSYSLFIYLFLFNFCKKCINFSCQFNKVPEDLVNKYLNKNPVLRNSMKKTNINKGK